MLKEILWGTPKEIQADQRLKDLGKRNRLSAGQKAELPELNHLSRRLFLRRGVTVIGGVAAVASPVGAYLLTHPDTFQSEEDKFFGEIANLHTREQVEKVDDYYSKNYLGIETARKSVLPIWVRSYIENSNSDKTPEEILPNIILFEKPENPEQAKIQLGAVSMDSRRKYIGPVQINYSTIASNKPQQKPDGSFMPGIVLMRTELMHELSHWDISFKDSSTLGEIINDYKVYDPPIEFADRIQISGFSFATIEPNEVAHSFFFNFDEIATDVVMSYIIDKGGHRRVFGYQKAESMRNFLDWIGLPGDKFVQYHRSSDL